MVSCVYINRALGSRNLVIHHSLLVKSTTHTVNHGTYDEIYSETL